MSANAKWFGELVLARRHALDLTQDEVALAGGPSDTTLGKIENGEGPKPSRKTFQRLDDALGWTPGSARRAYETGEPPTDSGVFVEEVPIVSAPSDTSLSKWLTRSVSELTDEEQEELWAKAEGVLEALKAQVLRSRERGSHLGDT